MWTSAYVNNYKIAVKGASLKDSTRHCKLHHKAHFNYPWWSKGALCMHVLSLEVGHTTPNSQLKGAQVMHAHSGTWGAHSHCMHDQTVKEGCTCITCMRNQLRRDASGLEGLYIQEWAERGLDILLGALLAAIVEPSSSLHPPFFDHHPHLLARRSLATCSTSTIMVQTISW